MPTKEELTVARREVRIAGFGGQGIVLSGIVLGTAAAVYANKFCTQVQSYGPEARGGACRTDVVISDEEILHPMSTGTDIMVCMSQQALNRYIGDLRDGGILIVDEDLVKDIPTTKDVRLFKIPATRIADEELKSKVFANIVMLGSTTELTKIVSKDEMRNSVMRTVPKATIERNLTALEKGVAAGARLVREEL